MLRGAGFFPSFGNGPPGAKVPQCQPYMDVSVTPYVWYQYRAGAWHGAGGRQDFNGTTLQGNAISATAPLNNQVLTWDTAGNTWKAA